MTQIPHLIPNSQEIEMENKTQSVRDALVERVAQMLADARLADGCVFRSREVPLRRGLSPAIVVRPVSEPSEPFSDDVDENRLIIAVEIHTRGDPYDKIADPIATAAHAVITQSDDLKLIAPSIRKRSTTWAAHEADETAGMVAMQYQFTYLSGADDIAALA